jgi:hypothetical protein
MTQDLDTKRIILPFELVQHWFEEGNKLETPTETQQYIAAHAVQWGADQELEACCELLSKELVCDGNQVVADLISARRPKPPSLKYQALKQLEDLEIGSEGDIIRSALEQLDD